MRFLIRIHELREWVEAHGNCDIKFDWKSQMIVKYSNQNQAESAKMHLDSSIYNGEKVKVFLINRKDADRLITLNASFDNI